MDRNKLGLSVKNSIMMEDLKCKFLGLINKQVGKIEIFSFKKKLCQYFHSFSMALQKKMENCFELSDVRH